MDVEAQKYMSSRRRSFRIATLVAFISMTCGCSRPVVRTVDDELEREGTGILEEEGQEIEGYILAGGAERRFSGRTRLTGNDSLIFWAERDTVVDGSYRMVKVIGPEFERSAVESLKMSEVKIAATILLTVGVVSAVVVGLAAIALDDSPLPLENN